ncbi:MAG TPA: S8/S53 family peptidase, partial [Thermoanaerobaculia bacterium]|nr:S8/S53 family peptidase [Thermoanaerobaculia bacterium]
GDWKPFADQFLAQAGKPATPLEINNQLGVRLAFLDTQPDGTEIPTSPGRSEHGFTMAHIARHLVCSPVDSERCAAKITTRLALPIVRFDPVSERRTVYDWKRGGFLGFQSHLADAIVKEVDDWQAVRGLPDAPQRLVLNISAAWDGDFFGGLDEAEIAEMRAGTRAVYQALQYAAENDVLVLAAAGNKRDCAEPSEGPMLPAAWEEGTPPDGICGDPPSEPLVYAVGGVDSMGQPLANSIPGGMPKRAAFAENAVVGTLEPGRSTRMYTGSSVATAVVSSIAAIVWDTLPGQRPAEVMKILDESDTALTLPANFWFRSSTSRSATTPQVHMLSLCKALQRACTPGVPNCPLPEGAECPEWTPAKSSLKKDWETPAAGSCHPWTGPQPEENPCPICNPPRISN